MHFHASTCWASRRRPDVPGRPGRTVDAMSASAALPNTAAVAAAAAGAQHRLAEFLAAERRRWVGVDPDLAAVVDAVTDLVEAGGKRLRPACCYWAFVGAGGE